MSYYDVLAGVTEGMSISFNNSVEQGTATTEFLVERTVTVRDGDAIRIDLVDDINDRKYSVEAQKETDDVELSLITSEGAKWYSEVYSIEIIAN